MARWEPDARERLVRAALDLFAEQGYDDTTVVLVHGAFADASNNPEHI